jgi:DNA mismatch repair protein MutL
VIEIEKGGSKLIRIRDNGCGVAQDELTLALSRHATSKIHDFADLTAIASLGFRGEALASISSVARLTLTSKPAGQETAWQAQAEGRDMTVQVRPAAHPVGTTVEVLDLFFNTPARRRFLKSDKTEFAHIEELIKRLALSRFDVSWTLLHNGQLVRQLKAVNDDAGRHKRLAALCGKHFAGQALHIHSQYEQMTLTGWILPAVHCATQLLCQYSYVNGRMMRDKLLGHAIRQAYGDWLAPEAQPAFVLYLTLPADDVDVNVHPAKHEVRFHQSRLVHDFVASALTDAIAQGQLTLAVPGAEFTDHHSAARTAPPTAVEQVNEPAILQWAVSQAAAPAGRQHSIAAPQWPAAAEPAAKPQHLTGAAAVEPPAGRANPPAIRTPVAAGARHMGWQQQHQTPPGWPLAVLPAAVAEPLTSAEPAAAQPGQTDDVVVAGFWQVGPREYLTLHQGQCWLLDGPKSVARLYTQATPVSQALLLPIRLKLQDHEVMLLTQAADQLAGMGFDFLLNNQTLIVRAVPQLLANFALADLLPNWWQLVADSQQHWWDALLTLLWQQPQAQSALNQALLELQQLPLLWHAVPLDLTVSLQQLQVLRGDTPYGD